MWTRTRWPVGAVGAAIGAAIALGAIPGRAEQDPEAAARLERLEEKLAAQERETAALRRELEALRRERGEASGPAVAAPAEAEGQPAPDDAAISRPLFEGPGGVEIYAFGDFQVMYRDQGDDGFAIGQLELDVKESLAPHLDISAGIAYDGEADELGIAVFTIDGRLFGDEGAHVVRTDKLRTSGIVLGKFDVPFGIAYREYASISRSLVTGPISVDRVHGSWNDLGVQLYLDTGVVSAVGYVVQGFGYEMIEEEGGVPIPHEMVFAGGGRLALKPAAALELGASFAGFMNAQEKLDMLMAGGDVTFTAGGLTTQAEYLFRRSGVVEGFDLDVHGTYISVIYDFEPVFVGARHATIYDPAAGGEQKLSTVIGFEVIENAEIRLEYTSDLRTGGNEVYLQFVGGSLFRPWLRDLD